jgi:hypothetical protein
VPEQPLVLVVEDEYFLKADLEQVSKRRRLCYAHHRRAPASVWLGRGSALREKEPNLPVIYVTASSAEEWAASHGVPNSILHSKAFCACAAHQRDCQLAQYQNATRFMR